MPNYVLSPKEHRGAKSRLTRALKSKDYSRIITVCDETLELFAEKGYPDDWMRWERAKEDADCAREIQNGWV